MFKHKFSKEFLCSNDLFLFVLKGWKNQEKKKSLGLVFDLYFISILEVFPRVFLCFLFSNTLFFTLEIIISILSIGSLFCGKISLWLKETTKL